MSDWKIRNILSRKRQAYVRTFIGENEALKPDAELVLRDLRAFCRAHGIIGYRTASGAVDPIAMANANGRREVYDRIMRYLHLPERTETQLDVPKEDF